MKKFIESIQNNFATILQSAAWLLSVLSTFIFPPPVAFSDNSEFLFKFVQFLVAACIGLMILPMRKYALKKHALGWWISSFIVLVSSIIIFLNYNSYSEKYTVPFPFGTENKAVIGKELKPDAKEKKEKEEHNATLLTNEELIANFAIGSEDEFDTIWQKEDIEHNRNAILTLYIASILSFALFVILLVQSIKCLNKRRT